MTQVNRDPVFGIRKAVANGMVSIGMQPNKELIDAVVDCLPDFFKQPLIAGDWPGDPVLKTPTPLNDLANTYRVWHRNEPGRVVAEFYGPNAAEDARRFCEIAGQ